MRLKRDAKILKAKAIASLKTGLSAFNTFDNDGRITTVLLNLQHAAEMLLKASLVQVGSCRVFGNDGRSIGMSKCLNLAAEHLKSLETECGVFRAIDAMRDQEQHWYAHIDEEVLFLEARAFITAFDDLLGRIFSEKLADHLPERILPVSSHPPPTDISTLFDSQFSQLRSLLRPGTRKLDEVHGRIRTLLAMEAHVNAGLTQTEKEVKRAEVGIRAGRSWQEVFPDLATMSATVNGQGAALTVRIVTGEAAPPVRIVRDGEAGADEATVVKEVDVWNRFPFQYKQMAQILGLASYVQVRPLAIELGLKDNPVMYRERKRGSQTFYGFSHVALDAMKQLIASGADTTEIYRRHNTATGKRKGRKL